MAIERDETSFSRKIRTNLTLLKCSGTIYLQDKTRLKIFFSYCLAVISVAVLVMNTSVYIYVFCIHTTYIETAIESFALIISLFGGLIRNLIGLWSREKIQEILNALDDLWEILNSEERNHITSSIKGTKNLTYFFLSQCTFTICFYAIAPLSVNPSPGNLNSTRILPYAFFTDVYQSPYYEIIYISQVASMFNIELTCVGVDMIGPLLITTVCGHLRVIQEQLKNIDFGKKIQSSEVPDRSILRDRKDRHNTIEEKTENGKDCSVESVSNDLKSCVNYHRTILTICTDIEQFTNIIFLTQLIGSTYILSAVGFKLSGNDQDKYKYLPQIIIGLVQLLICNWPPDALLTESRAVAEAAYFTPWYQWPKELQKSVHIITLRAQTPIRLTAGKFMNLSLETFTSMVSSAVSFFTMLRSVN